MYGHYNDVIAAAFICGTSRIATLQVTQLYSNYAGDWHQEVAHQNQDPAKEQLLIDSYQTFFEKTFLDLLTKLDVEEADGYTYLDNTLVEWLHECGPGQHDPISFPVVTAGSAAGWFKTGQYIDYRNRANTYLLDTPNWPGNYYPGVLYSQWHANVLQAMGVPPSEYELNGVKGYGNPYNDHRLKNQDKLWPSRLNDDASKILPFLKA
jgi:hypothetical protein